MAKNAFENLSVLSSANGDVPGDIATTYTLTVETPVVGSIDVSDDQDWYRFETKAATTYVFDLEGSATGAGTLGNPYLRLLDSAGNEIAANDDAGSPNSQLGYSAAADGLIYVSAQTADGGTGSFRLSAREVVGDVPGNTATTVELPLDTPVSGSIDFRGDEDWYRFETEPGKTYVFDLEGSDTGAGTLRNPYLLLLDEQGNPVTYNDDAGSANSLVGYSATADGLVYLSAQSPWGGGIGSFRLSAREVPGDVPDNTATTATLAVGTPVSGNIDFAFDQDWFRFEINRGATYIFDLEGTYLQVFDSDGHLIAASGSGDIRQLGFSPAADGVVFVSAGTPSWSDSGTGSYRLSAREVVGDVPGSIATTAELPPSAPVSGNIDFVADQDWYRFEVKNSSTYVFNLEGTATGAGTLGNPCLRLLDADGNEIASNDDAGSPNSQVGYSAAADGLVYVSALAADGGTGSFRLGAREILGDVPGNTATRSGLPANSSVSGNIDFATDQDWYRFDVKAGTSYLFDLEGRVAHAGTLVDPYLRLLDINGDEIAANDDHLGVNSQIGYTAAADGVAFVSAQAYQGGSGSYRLAARELMGEVPDNAATTAVLSVDEPISGKIDFVSDQDWYRIQVKAGSTYVFDLEGRDAGAGGLSDPYLRLLDADGNEIARPYYDSYPQIAYAAPADGAVFVSAETYAYWYGTGTYRLTAREVVGDVAGSAATKAGLTVDAPVSGNIDYRDDQDWYRFEVKAGTTYVFDVEGSATGAGTLGNPSPRLLDSDGNEIVSNDGYNPPSQIGYLAATDGVVFVSAEAQPYSGETGNYRLAAREIVGDVPGDASTMLNLPVDAAVSGNIDFPQDQDWYRFDVKTGATYVFDLEGSDTAAGTLGNPYLGLLDSDGNLIAADNGPIGYSAATDGLIFVLAEGVPYWGETGTYRLAARELVGDVPGTTATTIELPVDVPVGGNIDAASDQDWYRFDVKAGATYVFDLEGRDTYVGSLGNPYLRLLDAEGNEIATNNDTGNANSQIGHLATADGSLYVSAGTADGGTGSYRLGARELVGDVPVSTATTVELPVDVPVSGNIDFLFDQDWYRFEVKNGSTYVFDLEGNTTGAGTLENPYLRLLDSDGNEIASNDDAGSPNSQLGYSAAVDGLIYVSAGTANSGTGSFRLGAREFVGDVPDSTATKATLAVGGSLTGLTDYVGDRDWYRVEVQAGQTYAFDLEATGDGTGSVVNPLLVLRDADGNELRSDGNGGTGSNAQLGFSATADTVLYLDASGSDTGTGSYRLSGREVPRDQPDNETTAATLAVGGTTRAAIDFANDSDWFKAEVKAGHTYVVDVEGSTTLAGSLGDPRVVLSDNAGLVHQNFLAIAWGLWWDRAESDSLPAVAETESAPDDPNSWSQWTDDLGGNGHYYRVVNVSNGTDWQTANDLAAAAGAHLATITSFGENNFVEALLLESGVVDYAWLGGLQPNPTPEDEPAGGWAWVTSEPFKFGNWAEGVLVYEPDDQVVGDVTPPIENDDGGIGTNAQAGFTAIEDGVLSVRVSGDAAQTGTYTVTLREVIGDIAGNASTSKDLAICKQACSAVDFANDQDWFRVQVEAGQTYVFEARGAAGRNGTLDDPSLRLVDPAGNELATGGDAGIGLNDRILYTADADRMVYLTVGGANEDEHGSYKVVAREDDGGWFIDLPHLKNGHAMPEAAIQASSDNAPVAGGETYLTWIGGKGAYSDAIGVVHVEDGNVLDPGLVFSSSKALCVGESASLGTVGAGDRLGLFMIPNAAKTVPHLGDIGPDDLLLRNPDSGDLARSYDGVAPELIRLDGSAPALVHADLFFALDEDPGSRTANPLNPDGFAQATVGSFYRDGEEVCRLVAFEETSYGEARPDHDFNDAILALSVGRLSHTDIVAIHDYLLG
jgi:hypothetical protein